MKAKTILLGLLAAFPLLAAAQDHVLQDDLDYARVINVAPVPGPDVVRRDCRPVTTQAKADHSVGGAIAGGLLGAVVGSRFGEGHGRDAATVAGAIGGAMVGDRVGANASSDTSTREECVDVHEPGPPAGFNVTIEYEGQQKTIFMNHEPRGPKLRVHRRVTIDG